MATGMEEVCVCWTDGIRIWLCTAEMSLPLSREHGAPVLTVTVYTEHGDVQDAGDWLADCESNWRRCLD